MAKVKNPLFSEEARGSLGKEITYLEQRPGSVVTRHHKPSGIPSGMQKHIRMLNKFAYVAWSDLTDPERSHWEEVSKGLPVSGWNMFYKQFISEYLGNRRPWRTPTNRYLFVEMLRDDVEAYGPVILENEDFFHDLSSWDVDIFGDTEIYWKDGMAVLESKTAAATSFLSQEFETAENVTYAIEYQVRISDPEVRPFRQLYAANSEGGRVLSMDSENGGGKFENIKGIVAGVDLEVVGAKIREYNKKVELDWIRVRELLSGPRDMVIKEGRITEEGFYLGYEGGLSHAGGDKQDLGEGRIEFDVKRTGELGGSANFYRTSSRAFAGLSIGGTTLIWAPNFIEAGTVLITGPELPLNKWVRYTFEYSQSGRFLRIYYDRVLVSEETEKDWPVAPNDTNCQLISYNSSVMTNVMIRNVSVSRLVS